MSDKPDNEGWIEWHGVPANHEDTQVRYKDGEVINSKGRDINWHNSNIIAYRITQKETKKPEVKRYGLKDMGKIWFRGLNGDLQTMVFDSLGEAKVIAPEIAQVLAITRADATGFYEGEGL